MSSDNGCDNSCKSQQNVESQTVTVDTLSNLVEKISVETITNDDLKLEIKNAVVIPSWLEECETPFMWHSKQERGQDPELLIKRNLEKLDELFIDQPEFSLQRFVCLMKLVLEYYLVGDINQCCKYMNVIKGCLEEEILRNDPRFLKVKLSLGHVVNATEAHVHFILGKEEESKECQRLIDPVEVFPDTDKAALNAMKARFFLYSGYENGEDIGVTYAREALKLEPENPEFEYLLAKMLRQQRRDALFSHEIPREELKLLESLVKKEKTSKYLVYLAQAYRECASQAYKAYGNHKDFVDLKPTIEPMWQRSLEYYKEAVDLSPESPSVLRRVGYGIMNLNRKYADYDFARNCLLKSLEISENHIITEHMLGTFYLRYGNDKKKALEYFEKTAKAGSLAGLSDMIRVKWILDPENYDPCPDLENGISRKMKKKEHNQFLAQLGGYHLFLKRDFSKAIEYFKQIILEDKDSQQMTSFKSFFLKMNKPIDLYQYLANEALLIVHKHDSDSTSTGDCQTSEEDEADSSVVNQRQEVEDFLNLIFQVHPEFMVITLDEELVPKLIEASKEIESNWNQHSNRNNFRGRHNSNYSGFRGNRGRGYRRGEGTRHGNQDDGERRGRFSATNQREEGGTYGGNDRRGGMRRGGFNRGRGPRQNWRPRPRNDNESGEQENWRNRET